MINLSKTFHRSYLADGDLDPDSLHGVVEGFDWPTRREAKQWLDSHLRGLDIWRRHQQRVITSTGLDIVADTEYAHASMSAPIPAGRMNIVARDLARQLENSLTMTRMFASLRDVEAKYDAQRDMALEQYEALVVHLDSLEVS